MHPDRRNPIMPSVTQPEETDIIRGHAMPCLVESSVANMRCMAAEIVKLLDLVNNEFVEIWNVHTRSLLLLAISTTTDVLTQKRRMKTQTPLYGASRCIA